MAAVVNNAVVVFLLLVALGMFTNVPIADAVGHTILAVAVYLMLEWLGFFPVVPGWLLLLWSFAFGTCWYVEARRRPAAVEMRDRRWSLLLAAVAAVVLMVVGAW